MKLDYHTETYICSYCRYSENKKFKSLGITKNKKPKIKKPL